MKIILGFFIIACLILPKWLLPFRLEPTYRGFRIIRKKRRH